MNEVKSTVKFANESSSNDVYSDKNSDVFESNILTRTVSHQSSRTKRYDQHSKRVPAYYNRPGPGLYDNNSNLDKLSKFVTNTGPKIVKSSDLKGLLSENSP